jgi:deazaflavin-dependent oxidoreductase (nitroreductase family)
MLRFSRGRCSAAAILGWTIIQLTTTGAKTGQPRTLPLVGIFEKDRIALMGTSFGRQHNPGWYYNLKSNPQCSVLFRGETREYVARELEGEEYEKFFQMAVDQYAGYQTYRERAAHRHIPVMLLEPKK